MDCKYIEQNDIHEKYLLDKLNGNEKAEYLSHLNSCEICKNTLDSEKNIIGTVRHFGKIEMKSEIARQVAEIKSREKNVSWDMILKVAAIFFFLVITPGLVYYYQSIEPPKISELYNLDEAMMQPEEIEIVEEEKTERKETVKNILADNTDEKRIENMSDVLGSAGGQGAGSSIQSVGMAKPAKKSAARIKATEELAAEDDLEYEIDQFPSPTTESTLPEQDKYKKPDFVNVYNPEVNRAKVLSRKKMDPKSRSFFSDTKSEKMSMPKEQSVIKSDSKDYSSVGAIEDNILILNYKIDNQSIIVNMIPLTENSDFYLQPALPDSFPVIIKTTDKVNLEMDFYINLALSKIDSENILLSIESDNLVLLKIKDLKTFQIDLNSDTTKAIFLLNFGKAIKSRLL